TNRNTTGTDAGGGFGARTTDTLYWRRVPLWPNFRETLLEGEHYSSRRSIRGWHRNGIDHEHGHIGARRFQFQSKLLADRSEERRTVCRRWRRCAVRQRAWR